MSSFAPLAVTRAASLISIIFFVFSLATALCVRAEDNKSAWDVVVYGGTPAGITAALEAKRMGGNVVLVCPDAHLGGMTSSGLGWTDSKDGRVIGGLAREFYHRVWLHYQSSAAWKVGSREAYAKRVQAQPGRAIDDQGQVMWTFEPHVAETVFEDSLREAGIRIDRNAWLDRRTGGVLVADHRIRSVRMLSGQTYAAKVFIDATYEGDLVAAGGVTCVVGRDNANTYREPLNGIRLALPTDPHSVSDALAAVSPFLVPGDGKSGLLPGIEGVFPPMEKPGDADGRLQSFNYRLCLTTNPANRVPIEKPDGYREADYELLLRLYETGHPCGFSTQPMPNGKTDSNNDGPVSLDFVVGNSLGNYSEADYEGRRKYLQALRRYDQGLLWTIMHNPRIPEAERARWAKYGLAADEFADNGHWPYQAYVREARRMVGTAVMTQHHVTQEKGYAANESIGLGSYSLDSHGVRRVVLDGKLCQEGSFYVPVRRPYPIALGTIEPKREEITNLLNPVTLSATHAAFGSLRMEPTYMILGQSAGALAMLAARAGGCVQDVPYADLRTRLLAGGQVLAFPPAP